MPRNKFKTVRITDGKFKSGKKSHSIYSLPEVYVIIFTTYHESNALKKNYVIYDYKI